jgi:hypothetical protein
VTTCDRKVKRWSPPPPACRYFTVALVNLDTQYHSINHEIHKFSKLLESR